MKLFKKILSLAKRTIRHELFSPTIIGSTSDSNRKKFQVKVLFRSPTQNSVLANSNHVQAQTNWAFIESHDICWRNHCTWHDITIERSKHYYRSNKKKRENSKYVWFCFWSKEQILLGGSDWFIAFGFDRNCRFILCLFAIQVLIL